MLRRDTDGQKQRLAERAQELREQKGGYRGDGWPQQIRPGSLTQGKEDLDGRDEALKRSEGAP